MVVIDVNINKNTTTEKDKHHKSATLMISLTETLEDAFIIIAG